MPIGVSSSHNSISNLNERVVKLEQSNKTLEIEDNDEQKPISGEAVNRKADKTCKLNYEKIMVVYSKLLMVC